MKCPKKYVWEIEDGIRQKVAKSMYEECWIELEKDYMNIMNIQKIYKKDINKNWYFYASNTETIQGYIYIHYNLDNNQYVFRLTPKIKWGFKYKYWWDEFEKINNHITKWLLD